MAAQTTPADVAGWMASHIDERGHLEQELAIDRISELFGDDFLRQNDAGNWGVARAVLYQFKKLTADTVVWEQGERYWRKRLASDAQGRKQEG